MKYDKTWLYLQLQAGERIKYLFFWGHQPSRNGEITSSCFSQWWEEHPFSENGIVYKTAEHYMMARKARLFKDGEMLEKIIASKSAAEAKKFGRSVRNFDQYVWEKNRSDIVIQANYLKFSQHEELKTFLLSTNNRVLVEASPVDKIWGIGLTADDELANYPENWKGLNLLGFCLMEVREMIK